MVMSMLNCLVTLLTSSLFLSCFIELILLRSSELLCNSDKLGYFHPCTLFYTTKPLFVLDLPNVKHA